MPTLSVAKTILKIQALMRKQDPVLAAKLCDDLLADFPRNDRARALRKQIDQQAGAPNQSDLEAAHNLLKSRDYTQAIAQCDVILDQFPNAVLAWNILGSAYHESGDYHRAIDAFSKMRDLDPTSPDALYNLATAHMKSGDPSCAIDLFQSSISIRPDFAFAHFNLANCQRDVGNIDAAVASYDRAITLDPDYLASYTNLGQVKDFDLDDPKLNRLKSALNTPSTPLEEQCKIHFILARSYEYAGDVEQTIDTLAQGNEARRRLLSYDFKSDIDLFKTYQKAAPALVAAPFDPVPRGNCPIPIFIVGMPRSGTTLFEQILTSHSQISGAGELPYAVDFGHKLATGMLEPNQKTLSIFRKQYLRSILPLADGRSYVTDKMPSNFRVLSLIMKALPEAIIFHATRDARAVCWSNYKHNFYADGLGYSCRMADTVGYHGLYRDLMQNWTQKFGSRIQEVNYEQLVQNQRETSERAVAHIGVSWEEACMEPHKNKRKIQTASKMQVREKLYQGSSLKWQKFAPHLGDAFNGLSPDWFA